VFSVNCSWAKSVLLLKDAHKTNFISLNDINRLQFTINSSQQSLLQ